MYFIVKETCTSPPDFKKTEMPAAESGSMEILELRHVAEGVYEPNVQQGRVSTFRAMHLVANSTKRHCVRIGGIPTAEADFSLKHWILRVLEPNVIQTDGQTGKLRASFDLQRKRKPYMGAARK
ncbi:hypothetical protein AAIH70_25705 [Neorhizobium sp. BT27B]|uniref:hypothetical protein n=1 Tax=Neorhizobium sp. BT27B TaxID=3142625 RepID=UPI003D287556